MGSYRDLEVYKLAHELAVEIHKMSLGLPKFEMYEEGSQIRRAVKSVASNIVEGFGRRNIRRIIQNFLFTRMLLVMKLKSTLNCSMKRNR